MRVHTATESRVDTEIELIDAKEPFLYFDRGAGGGTHFYAHHKVVRERAGHLFLAERVSVAEESFGRYWFMPEIPSDTERTLVFVKTGRNCRIRPYRKANEIRVLASDKIGHKMAMLVLSPGAELTIERPDHLFDGLSLFHLQWDGRTLLSTASEDPEDRFSIKRLTYI